MSKRNIKIIFSFLVVVGMLAFFYFLSLKNLNQEENFQLSEIKQVEIAGKILRVELALTSEEWEKGLSSRENLAENEGMLFIFPKDGKYYFWMKEMNFPIDIIWLDKNFKVIYIEKNAQPDSYPETFGPDLASQYVLEVSAGFSEKNNLGEQDFVEFLP